MTQNKLVKPLLLAVGLPLLYLADVSPGSPAGFDLGARRPRHRGRAADPRLGGRRGAAHDPPRGRVRSTATAAATSATAQQQAATAQQQSATAQQQSATASSSRPRPSNRPPRPEATRTGCGPGTGGYPAVGTIVNTLPAGCTQETKGGVEYQRCGNVYYRAAFQGNSLVYVVQQP